MLHLLEYQPANLIGVNRVTEIELLQSIEVAHQTLLLKFKRPKKYLFEPGQYTYLTLLVKKYPDHDNHSRILSFASTPNELTLDFLVHTGNSGFKLGLAQLRKGDYAKIGNPIGSFNFNSSTKKGICIAGGIGIAPFFSLFKSIDSNCADISLVWSNRSTHETPLFQEMYHLINVVNTFAFFPILTREKDPIAPFLPGRISQKWLVSNDLIMPEAEYLLCGSTAFVKDISSALKALDISTSQIKLEAFSGYV